MMYNYPFFTFPYFRKSSNYYSTASSYVKQPIDVQHQYLRGNIFDYRKTPSNSQVGSGKSNNFSYRRHTSNKFDYDVKEKNQYNNEKHNTEKIEGTSNKTAPYGFSFLNNLFSQNGRSNDEEYFELFGLKLYYDDLLLIGLIFFLYKEDVKDQYLFFSLILLLLS